MQRLISIILLCIVALPASAQEATANYGSGDNKLLLRSTTDIAILEPAIELFLSVTPNVSVTYEQWGSNDLFAISKASCRGEGAVADVVFSSAVHHMVDLVNTACAQPYQSDLTSALPENRRWRDELWGITEEPAVVIYNTEHLTADQIPQSRFELLDLMRQQPEFLQGKIATYDIEASGLGYLFAFSDSLEATTFGAILEGFSRTNAVATCCSSEIIRSVSSGKTLIAYNVLGSYVENAAPANVGVLLPRDYTLFLSRGFIIPKQSQNLLLAGQFLDFLLSSEGQSILARSGLIYSDDPEETGLQPLNRRFIALTPSLLVALDSNTTKQFVALWKASFTSPPMP